MGQLRNLGVSNLLFFCKHTYILGHVKANIFYLKSKKIVLFAHFLSSISINFASKPQYSLIALSNNSAWNVVYGHVVLCQDDPENVGEVTKKLYGDLCSQLHLSR